MDIGESTRSYERWMRNCAPVVESHLRDKHAKMRADPFQFLRGTYYRWAQLWPGLCSNCVHAPRVLSVGDLHVDSFGTWRDREGRLCWGVDDFDEAYPLPYTNDLVRLVASAKIARKLGLLGVRTKLVSEIILTAYRETLSVGGRAYVLAEGERPLEKLGIEALKAPNAFWQKLCSRPAVHRNVPADALRSMKAALPEPKLECRIISREAGLGSLGQQRFVAIAECRGGYIAREAKRLIPSANKWLNGGNGTRQSYYRRIITSAIRSPDPYQQVDGNWLIRRLSPDSNPIKIEELSCKRDEELLLYVMGSETANVHLGSRRRANYILADLKQRGDRWLWSAARKMAKAVRRDWKHWKG